MRDISPGYWKLRYAVLKRDGFTCQLCGCSPPLVKLEVDHIKPVAEGGKDTMENLRATCFGCNRGRGALQVSVGHVEKAVKKLIDYDKFQELVAISPALQVLFDEAIMRKAGGKTTLSVWYKEFKPRVDDLVGMFAETANEYLGTSEAYDIAYTAIFTALMGHRNA